MMNTHRWVEHTWREMLDELEKEPVVILPVGSVEPHGYHLPLNTDMLQPMYVAEKLCDRIDCLILPELHYGWVDSLASFPGAITVSFEALYLMTRDILASLKAHGVKKIMILSGHASSMHLAALKKAALELAEEMRILLICDYDLALEVKEEGEENHAGRLETSRIMDIKPDAVREFGPFEVEELPEFLVVRDKSRYYKYAVLSRPEEASADYGRRVNEHIVNRLAEIVKKTFCD